MEKRRLQYHEHVWRVEVFQHHYTSPKTMPFAPYLGIQAKAIESLEDALTATLKL
jgi:hypothetical protein